MNRRDFMLKTLYSSLALGFAGGAQAQNAMSGMNHAGMRMPAADLTNAAPLASLDVLPKGLPLSTLPVLANQSSDAQLFKATLTAAPMTHEIIKGKPTTIWAYNQSAAPLLIEWTEGMTVEIELINDLPQTTTIHWHGLPVPPDQDGAPQDGVPPKGRRMYRFTLPDDCAGTYWFHPHPHGITHEQVFRGLAGVIVVKPKHKDALTDVKEVHWVVTDLKLNADGRIAENDANDVMNGREGQFLLVNGQYQPSLNVSEPVRVRLWNATNARFLNLQWLGESGQAQDLLQIGTDGGLLTAAESHSTLLVASGERVELLLSPKESKMSVHASAYNQGKMGGAKPTPATPLLSIHASPMDKGLELPAQLRAISPLGGATVTQNVVFSETMSMENGVHQMNFLLNGKKFDMQRVDFTSKEGEIEEWRVENTSDMDHPFHIHGGQFQLQRREWIDPSRGSPTAFSLAWKDTVNVKSGERVVFKMVQKHKGLRMLHCHILEHEDAGMMANLNVV
ncbi:multicopper oxidase family protein [Hydromonas duriensis]|uniref:Bilirubin oxidase n=1 Tax=Hydromonas duriensis TaxID=1527608 RepID=A0A4R6YA02_9BURK|nr:multicopper oxidase family protein [Hydromonas duriensis]TDR32325.1 bilirubin oxidase [Hydromonas duriensis]